MNQGEWEEYERQLERQRGPISEETGRKIASTLQELTVQMNRLVLVQMAQIRAKKSVEEVDFVKREGVLYLNVRQYDGFQSLTWEVNDSYYGDNEDPTP